MKSSLQSICHSIFLHVYMYIPNIFWNKLSGCVEIDETYLNFKNVIKTDYFYNMCGKDVSTLTFWVKIIIRQPMIC